jgi:hypothetical protein
MPDSQVSSDFLVGVLAVLAFLGAVLAFVAPKFRRWGRFLDAWEGYVDPSTGDKVPGVPARLTAVELAQRDTAAAVARVEEQAGAAASAASAVTQDVHHLSGQVSEVDRKVDELAVRQDATAAEQTQLRAAVEGLSRIVGKDASPNRADQTGSQS